MNDSKLRDYDRTKIFYEIVSESWKSNELPTDILMEEVKATFFHKNEFKRSGT